MTPTTTADMKWEPGDTPSPVTPYQPVPGATALLRRYTNNLEYFRSNRYVTNLEVYDFPGRGWNTHRYCFPSSAIQSSRVQCRTEDDFMKARSFRTVDSSKEFDESHPTQHLAKDGSDEFPVQLAEIMLCPAAKAMAVRTIMAVNQIQTLPTVRADGDGKDQLQFAGERLRKQLESLQLPVDGLRLVCNPQRARTLLGWSSDDKRNHREVATLLGIPLVAENTVAVTNNTRKYAWPDNMAALVYKQACPADACYSTIQFRFLIPPTESTSDMMCVETKTDGDGIHAHIVEEYYAHLACPELAFVLTW